MDAPLDVVRVLAGVAVACCQVRRARLVGESAQRRREVGSWLFECEAEMLAAAARQLRVELSGALAEYAPFGLPFRPVGNPVREVALALGGRSGVCLGEFEALAFQRELGHIRAPAAQHASLSAPSIRSNRSSRAVMS